MPTLGPACSVEVEGKSTTAADFLAFRCSADGKKSPVVVPCNLVNCSMQRCLSATWSFNFSMRDFFAKASSLRFRCLTCSRPHSPRLEEGFHHLKDVYRPGQCNKDRDRQKSVLHGALCTLDIFAVA